MLEFTKFKYGFSFAEGKNQYAICENSHNRRGKYYYLIVNGIKQNTRADLNTCIKLANEIESKESPTDESLEIKTKRD